MGKRRSLLAVVCARPLALGEAAFATTLVAALATPAYGVPSYARQTGMACQVCHTVFPELTPFGRSFKLNGYQIDNLPQVQGITASKATTLTLNEIPPFSMMFQASFTHTAKALPDSMVAGSGAQNGQVLFPQQASLFYAGRIAPGLGTFVQMTYDSASGKLHWDNTDIRYARQVGERITYGLTVNNNPTVQDVWNSTPAWQTPFDQRSSAAPIPGAATQIDGVLAGRGVVGVTGYLWLNRETYVEGGFYRSSPQGFNVNGLAGPLDSTAGGLIDHVAPYWRVAHERQWAKSSWSIGAYGMATNIGRAGEPIGTPTDGFRDIALDSQYQFVGDPHIFTLQTTFIDEHQTLTGSVAQGAAANLADTLETYRFGGSYYFQRRYGGALGLFTTTGSSDALLYQAAPVFGFAIGSPNSHGWIGELNYVPWENVRLVVQYVDYLRFNGAGANYDGAGTNARNNNTLYLLAWFAF